MFAFLRGRRRTDPPLRERQEAAPAFGRSAGDRVLSGRVAFRLDSFGPPVVDVVLPPPPRVVVASLNCGGAALSAADVAAFLRRGAGTDGSPAAVVFVGVQEASRKTWASLEALVGAHLVDHERVPLTYAFGDRSAPARRIGLGVLCYAAKGWRCAPCGPAVYANLGVEAANARHAFKGALCCRVALSSSLDGGAPFEIAAAVAHLPAHEGRMVERVRALATLGDALAASLGPADAAFFFGDLNFRLAPDDRGLDAAAALASRKPEPRLSAGRRRETPAADAPKENADAPDDGNDTHRSAVLDAVAAGNYASLLEKYDELAGLRRRLAASPEDRRVLLTWRDAAPAFAPTFKVARGVAGPVYSEKRIPAYTDRVLYAGRAALLAFDAIPAVVASDHKPTRAVFTLDAAPPERPRRRRGSIGAGKSKSTSPPRLSPGVPASRYEATSPA